MDNSPVLNAHQVRYLINAILILLAVFGTLPTTTAHTSPVRLRASLTPQSGSNAGQEPFTIAVRGSDNGIYWTPYYGGQVWPQTETGWVWRQLPGATLGTPGMVDKCSNGMYFAVRGTDNGIYFGFIPAYGSFQGWNRLPGATISNPALTTDCGHVYMAVRGTDGGIYLNTYTGGVWQGWVSLPGATLDTPGVSVLGGSLWVAVEGTNHGIYVGQRSLGSGVWSGFSPTTGATLSPPRLAVDSNYGVLYMAVRGTDNRIYINQWSPAGCYPLSCWLGFSPIPTGASPDPPGFVINLGVMYVCVRGTDNGIYCSGADTSQGGIASAWSTWVNIPGATPSGPTLSIYTYEPYFQPANAQPTQPLAPAIPEYNLGLPLLAFFMVVAYGLVRRKTKTPKYA